MRTEAHHLRAHALGVVERPEQPLRVHLVFRAAAAADDTQHHHLRAVRARGRDTCAVVSFGGDQARHECAVARPSDAFALRGNVCVVVHEIPAVNVVYVAVAVVVHARLAVRFGLVRPELIAQLDVVELRAVIEERNGNTLV